MRGWSWEYCVLYWVVGLRAEDGFESFKAFQSHSFYRRPQSLPLPLEGHFPPPPRVHLVPTVHPFALPLHSHCGVPGPWQRRLLSGDGKRGEEHPLSEPHVLLLHKQEHTWAGRVPAETSGVSVFLAY